MVTYEYRCADHGVSTASAPLGRAPAEWPCPACGQPTRRVYGGALLAGGAYARAIEATKRTSAEPTVVTRLPETMHWRGSAAAPKAVHPDTRRLPRP
jgi:hypothetical protein